MKYFFRTALTLFFGILIFCPNPGCAAGAEIREFVPCPRLLSPAGDKLNIKGKDSVDFVWSPHEGLRSMRRYYDFRLYKGYDTVESGLITKMQVPPRDHSVTLKSADFTPGEVYTWSLRQVYYDSRKSGRSTQSFTVINE